MYLIVALIKENIVLLIISTIVSRLGQFLNEKIRQNFGWLAKLKSYLLKRLLDKKFVFVFKEGQFRVMFFIIIISAAIVAGINFGGQGYLATLERSNNKIMGGLDEDIIESYESGEAILPEQLKNQDNYQQDNGEIESNNFINYNSLTNFGINSLFNNGEVSGIRMYSVKSGDSISKIAENFGIDSSTIVWANNIYRNQIFSGQELIILPVSGVLHNIEIDDTIEGIARQYQGDVDEIKEFNNIEGDNLKSGQAIIIPGGKISSNSKITAKVIDINLPYYPDYYLIPTTGINWGEIHYKNAVDIANSCETEVVASADGLVLEAGNYNGYGNYIKIQHDNNTETVYAHLDKILVSKGAFAARGSLIGLMGNTGNSTGCHLHFEIRGAKNPFGNAL